MRHCKVWESTRLAAMLSIVLHWSGMVLVRHVESVDVSKDHGAERRGPRRQRLPCCSTLSMRKHRIDPGQLC